MDFVVYGSNGYIGKELINYLKIRKHRAIGITRKDIDLEKQFIREDIENEYIRDHGKGGPR